MITLCPACWRTVARDARVCPACGADLAALDRRTYVEKLVAALGHPDRETVMRAAAILGDRGDPVAVAALVAALERYRAEPHVSAALVRALGRFDDPLASRAISEALGHPSFMVRAAAAEVLARRREDPRGAGPTPSSGRSEGG